MSEGFRTPPEELQHLLGQIAELKATLREIAGRLSQIEQHVKRAFRLPKSPPSRRTSAHQPRAPLPPPTLSPSDALKLFDELPPLLESHGREGVERRLGGLEIPDLKLIVQELGAPLPSKPSRKALTAAIFGRVNESLLLSRNRNITSPRSAAGDATGSADADGTTKVPQRRPTNG
jgi:hypothetical protein